MKRRFTLFAPLVVGLTFTASLTFNSCAFDLTDLDEPDTQVPISVTAFAVGTPMNTLLVEVSAKDMDQPLVFNLKVKQGVASGTIGVPAGVARTFTVTAYDDQGNVTHQGAQTVDVSPGDNPPLDIILMPITGQLPITVTFGQYSVLITPASATIDVTVTNELQLEITVLDATGELVVNPKAVWATTNPSIASVSNSGLVKGLSDGLVTIAATFEGIAGLSEITVIGLTQPNPNYPACLTPEEIALADEINATRVQNGVPALPVDTRLVQASRWNAEWRSQLGVPPSNDYISDGSEYGYLPIPAVVIIQRSGYASAADFWASVLNDPNWGDVEGDVLSLRNQHLGVGFYGGDGQFEPGWGLMFGRGEDLVIHSGSCIPNPQP